MSSVNAQKKIINQSYMILLIQTDRTGSAAKPV